MSDSEDNVLSSTNYPLVTDCDMNEEERGDATEVIVTAVEKFPGDFEQAAKFVKESLDKKFGADFHVFVGSGFSYTIESEAGHRIALTYGMTAVVAYKAS